MNMEIETRQQEGLERLLTQNKDFLVSCQLFVILPEVDVPNLIQIQTDRLV